MTLLTDYALAGVTGWLGCLLFRAQEGHAARSCWAVAFAALALGAALGGTYHGFAPVLAEDAQNLLWKATVLAIGVGTFGMVVGSSIGTTTGTLRKLLLSIAGTKLVIFLAWMLSHDDFIYVTVDTGIAMALVALLHGWTAVRGLNRGSLWMLGGVGVSAFAGAIQASGYTLHANFNHNDLYHVIQIAAMTLFYFGARRLRDYSMPEGKR